MKVPTEAFPFDYEDTRKRAIRSSTDEKPNAVRVEVGRSISSSPKRHYPASDVVKIRVYRGGKSTTPYYGHGITTEEIRLRKGDVVVRDARGEASRRSVFEPTREWETTQNQKWGDNMGNSQW
ncbi:hypothetical protein BDV18DRAFT_161438 [Aspergillus unguis]